MMEAGKLGKCSLLDHDSTMVVCVTSSLSAGYVYQFWDDSWVSYQANVAFTALASNPARKTDVVNTVRMVL